MKFSMRVRLAFIVMALVMMLSGSAWAAYNIDPIVRLDSTGKNLDVTFTFQKDGVNDPIYGVLNAAVREAIGEKLLACIRLEYPDGSRPGEKLSQSPIAINEDSIKATFLFDEALENGEYLFLTLYTDTNAETASWSMEQIIAYFDSLNPGITFEQYEELDAPYKNPNLENDLLVNGGQPVNIKRASLATTSATFRSRAAIRDGKTVYDEAQFDGIDLYIEDPREITASDEQTGTILLLGGDYSIVDAEGKTYAKTNEFEMRLNPSESIGGYVIFQPAIGGKFVSFVGTAETGLNGQTFEWSHISYDSGAARRSGVFPNFLSTQAQLDSFVPYAEYVLDSSGNVTGLQCRLVEASDVTRPVPAPLNGRVRARVFRKGSSERWHSGAWKDFSKGSEVTGYETFNSPIAPGDIEQVRIDILNLEQSEQFQWKFYPQTTAGPALPPSVPDNTNVEIESNTDGKIVGISVKTTDGSPIPPNVLFKIWLMAQNVQGQSISVKATSGYVGPFVVESGSGGVLNIDVDNLKNPDGSKASITADSYVVKFADEEENYVGTTEAIMLKGTGTTTPPNDNNNGGGGCNSGFGMAALLLTGCGLVTRKSRKA